MMEQAKARDEAKREEDEFYTAERRFTRVIKDDIPNAIEQYTAEVKGQIRQA
jgi:hypothetical protein